MTRDELLQELGIAPEGDIGRVDSAATRPKTVVPPSPTALQLDNWSMRRGEEALKRDPLKSIIKRKLPKDAPARQKQAAYNKACHEAADFLGAAFEPTPKLAEKCEDEARQRFMQQMMETEDYHKLHSDTKLDEFASELAAGHFAKGYVALCEQEPAESDFKRDMQALSAAGEALQNASQDVSDLRDAQQALGGMGANHGKLGSLAEVRARFTRIKNDEDLRRILELAGRYRRAAQAKQRQKTLHGRDDMVGVQQGSDLGSVIPSELAALGDDDLELDALRRFSEAALMCRDYRGVKPVARGPIVVVVDESGSMGGEPIACAKAFALAMGWVAKHQKRWICFVGFSGGTDGTFLAMPPDRWDDGALLDWLEHFYGGGTTMDVPLDVLPQRWGELGCPEGKTDIICITDAIVRVPKDLEKNFLAWKDRVRAKFYTIVLGGEEDGGDLKRVCDRLWSLPDLDLERGAIQELMSL